MNQDKMYLINKLFNNKTIRTVWDKDEEKYYISVVDVVGILTESDNPRKYWSVLKTRLKKEDDELTTICSQLKLKAADGKYYNTDVCDIEGMFRIIESIPSKKAEPMKLWLARLGGKIANNTRIDEIGESVITNKNNLNYEYIDENKQIKNES